MDFNIFNSLFGNQNNLLQNDTDDFFVNATLQHAENMARTGFSDNQIMGATGLSQTEVDFMKNQNGIF